MVPTMGNTNHRFSRNGKTKKMSKPRRMPPVIGITADPSLLALKARMGRAKKKNKQAPMTGTITDESDMVSNLDEAFSCWKAEKTFGGWIGEKEKNLEGGKDGNKYVSWALRRCVLLRRILISILPILHLSNQPWLLSLAKPHGKACPDQRQCISTIPNCVINCPAVGTIG